MFKISTYDRIHEFVTTHPSSCKYLTSNLGWQCSSLTKSWNCEVNNLKGYIFLQSYLSNFPLHSQILGLLMNLILQICPLITPKIPLCDDEPTIYHKNQVPLHSPCSNQFHAFMVLTSLLNSCDDYDAQENFHHLQGVGSSCLAHSEHGSIVQSIRKIVQMNPSFLIRNQESNVSTSSSNHFSILGDSHLNYHFPMRKSDESCFTHFDINCLAYFS